MAPVGHVSSSRKSTEEKLAALKNLGEIEPLPVLTAALGDRSNLVIARAAALCQRRRLRESVPALAAAYQRLWERDPSRRDKGCLGKTAIIRALYELDYLEAGFYQEALRYRQMEPCWGGQEDTAVEVRRVAAAGFAASNRERSVFTLLDALLDSERPVRLAVVQAIASLETDAAEAVLRLKALNGDPSPEVTGECLRELLRFAGSDLPGFVARFLDHPDPAVRDLAALALGESKQPDAIQFLIDRWNSFHPDPGLRPGILRALCLARNASAFALLYDIIERETRATAAMAVEHLAMYQGDSAIRREVEARLLARGDESLMSTFRQSWG